MADVLVKRNGKRVNSPFVFTADDVDRLVKNSPGETLTFVNVITRRQYTRKGPAIEGEKKKSGRKTKK